MSTVQPTYYNSLSGCFEKIANSSPFPIAVQKSRTSGIEVISSVSFVFPNSAAINTQVIQTITSPVDPLNEYMIAVYNPSTVTDLTLKLFLIETGLGGGTRDAFITSLIIPKSQTVTGTTINCYAFFVHGPFLGKNSLKLVLSNNTALGGSDGFTAYLRIREVM